MFKTFIKSFAVSCFTVALEKPLKTYKNHVISVDQLYSTIPLRSTVTAHFVFSFVTHLLLVTLAVYKTENCSGIP